MPILHSNRVLIPVDIANLTPDTLDLVRAQTVSNGGTHILAVFANNEQTSASNWGTIDGESREDYATRDIRHRLQGTAYADADIHVAFGDPAEQIAKVARELDADLVILPVGPKGVIDRLFGNTVAEKVVRNLHCPLLILPIR
jgi:nucleotide-binding universal stress UspA family protein